MVHGAERFGAERHELVERLFPGGIPSLWCPPLTHFGEDGKLDRDRMRAHLRYMQPWVRGWLVPGTTGEGWDLTDEEVRELVDLMVDEVHALRGHLLVGALQPTAAAMARVVEDVLAVLARRAGTQEPIELMTRTPVRGFVITAPHGARLTQPEIRAGLDQVLSLRVPMALYQLPQVTKNEMSAETVQALAERHPTLYLLKDSSGMDRVAASGFRELFLVRGAEDRYAQQLPSNGGRYDDFLLASANCFPRHLGALVADLQHGAHGQAERFSDALTRLMSELLSSAGRVGYGNAFANATKALDHFLAHGPGASAIPAPRVHCGKRLPAELIEAAGEALRRHRLMPERGYLDS